jgi:hypothetical protein
LTDTVDASQYHDFQTYHKQFEERVNFNADDLLRNHKKSSDVISFPHYLHLMEAIQKKLNTFVVDEQGIFLRMHSYCI